MQQQSSWVLGNWQQINSYIGFSKNGSMFAFIYNILYGCQYVWHIFLIFWLPLKIIINCNWLLLYNAKLFAPHVTLYATLKPFSCGLKNMHRNCTETVTRAQDWIGTMELWGSNTTHCATVYCVLDILDFFPQQQQKSFSWLVTQTRQSGFL